MISWIVSDRSQDAANAIIADLKSAFRSVSNSRRMVSRSSAGSTSR